jgi:uncharacterized protein
MERIYHDVLLDHFKQYDQMAFLSGPRQVGKTTLSTQICSESDHSKYLNWDISQDRALILGDEATLTTDLLVDAILEQRPLIVFDEIHKYKQWKNYLKGFIDAYKGKLNILVTGSAKLNVARRGGDSLMGRYFHYRVHPLSVRELLTVAIPNTEWQTPLKLNDNEFDILYNFGGFPEPLSKQSTKFYNRWQQLRLEQILTEDIQNSEQIQNLAQLEVLAELLKHQASKQVKYSELAKKVRVTDTTIRRWITILESYYYCFSLKPWTKNISRSLIKEPKLFLWDWSVIEDKGSKTENFVACHLLKAVHFWQDMGLGKYDLYYIRDKEKNEVDFLITKANKPWILVEVKSSATERLSKNLVAFQQQLQAPHAFQLARDLPYVDIDCFKQKSACIVSLKTFLSQLI